MLKNYLISALRSLKKQKAFALINLLGMAVGLAGFAIFALMGGSKLQADRFHEKAADIYCLIQIRTDESQKEEHTTFVPAPLAPAIKSAFPEVRDITRVLSPGRIILKRGEDSFYETDLLFADPNFFSIFSFPLADGSPEAALREPDSLVLTQRTAAKYFGTENPIGRVLILGRERKLTVTGVARDIPRTSSLRFDFLASMDTAHAMSKNLEEWTTNRHTAFLLAGAGFEHAAFEKKLPKVLAEHYPDSPSAPKGLYVRRFRDFRLNSRNITSILGSSHPASVWGTLGLGVLLLFVVSVNFVNLSTARHMQRAREIGLRKVIGASRRQLIVQFMGESLLLSFLALPPAVLLYEILHPALYAYMGDFGGITFTSGLSNSIWNYPFLLKYLAAAAVLAGLFTGMVPALYLSKLQPVRVLSGKSGEGLKKKRGSRVLIGFQFTLAVIFIAGSGIIKEQFGHLLRADLGFNRDSVAAVRLPVEALPKLDLLKTKISGRSGVVQVTASARPPIVWEDPRPVRPPDAVADKAMTFQAYGVDYGFTETLQIPIVRGRGFSRDEADRSGFILNEAAVKKLGWDNPIGMPFVVGDRTGSVVGVAKDFLFADIGFAIPPAVLYLDPENLGVLLVKYSSTGNFQDLRDFIKTEWQGLFPNLPLDCTPLDEVFTRIFGLLGKIANFLNLIGLVIVLFSCLGLLGLASYLVERRTKEIGIRKVLGASSSLILWRLARGYIVPVMAANIAALGLIAFGWHKVLQTGLLFFTGIGGGVYARALLFSLIAAAVAVGSRTWKAAIANPADSLRRE